MGGFIGGAIGGAASNLFGGGASGAADQQLFNANDAENAATTNTEILANAQKGVADRFKILADTQTKIQEDTQEVAQKSAQTEDQLASKWDQILGPGGGGQ